MSQLERIYRIDQLLSDRRSISKQDLLDILEISLATLKRDITYMQERLYAPIIFDRDLKAYRFDHTLPKIGGQYELPGMWFSAEEIHALLTMQHLLANLGSGGLLHDQVAPLMARLNGLLGSADSPAEEIRRRILIVGTARRQLNLEHFEKVGSGLLRRKRLMIRYHARSTNEITDREVSPQRLVYYRENWYLDAWCHLRRELRNFSIDAMKRVEMLDKPVKDIADRTLKQVLGPGYGIFGGKSLHEAKLRFHPDRARWVSNETWHPKCHGYFEESGHYILTVPYSDPRELVGDILRHGHAVEVLSPPALRQAIYQEASALRDLHAPEAI